MGAQGSLLEEVPSRLSPKGENRGIHAQERGMSIVDRLEEAHGSWDKSGRGLGSVADR